MIFIWLFLLERAQIVHDIVCADGDCDDTLRQAVSTVGLITCFRTGSTTSPETASRCCCYSQDCSWCFSGRACSRLSLHRLQAWADNQWSLRRPLHVIDGQSFSDLIEHEAALRHMNACHLRDDVVHHAQSGNR